MLRCFLIVSKPFATTFLSKKPTIKRTKSIIMCESSVKSEFCKMHKEYYICKIEQRMNLFKRIFIASQKKYAHVFLFILRPLKHCLYGLILLIYMVVVLYTLSICFYTFPVPLSRPGATPHIKTRHLETLSRPGATPSIKTRHLENFLLGDSLHMY